MGQRLTDGEANVAAEARAVEEGHQARVMPGGWVKVTSDTYHGKWYEVIFVGHIDGLITFTCRPHGESAYAGDHLYATSTKPGRTPCKHAALVARRLEREGLADYDDHGRWCATAKAIENMRAELAEKMPENPLEGLPS